ncbi:MULTISPECIES: hypothetical protein [unclassified Pseudoalteromonas]|uniref:hypothetical protein n=1 Tax=unclassified Pseudoalteromonas TaxID=194690 RepID=UPI001F3119B6|nr:MULTISPECIES: hypothetical protein [unclassified Pseudoalteromonas]MCF2826357.1 hypothetical protein [Pseudoalteromonas sp. OF5H-5]MCF2834533.1 hypothetical protein [Pseudoalteromonas sp. DL2-H6]MCF2926390.1 hypothetical protein [Pseudoalteromonas sp. DL2-H1]
MNNTGIVKNPLSVIAIFAGVAEISGTGVLPFIDPENQELYIWFLMLFPFTLVLLFFATLNWNHRALYAPSDYKSDESFLESANGGKSQREGIASMEKVIEAKVYEVLNASDGAPSAESKKSIAEKITESIKTSAFITVDARSLTGHDGDVFDLPYVAFSSFDSLTNEIFFLIEKHVRPFEYGHSWVLRNDKGEVIKNSRMITKTKIGVPCSDSRGLKEVGIIPGMTITVSKP